MLIYEIFSVNSELRWEFPNNVNGKTKMLLGGDINLDRVTLFLKKLNNDIVKYS